MSDEEQAGVPDTAMPPHTLEPGTVLSERFVLTEVIGRGTFGTVWRARDLRFDGMDRAVKVLSYAGPAADEVERRFGREISVLSQLESPHIVGVLDHGRIRGRPFLVMEFLRGQDLLGVLGPPERSTALPWQEVVRCLRQACDALAEAHRMGLVHRDLKPSNLFLHETGSGRTIYKIIDFGIAKSLEADASLSTSGPIGTPAYMAPEQVDGTPGPESDVYALGMIAYQALSGHHPFTGSSFGEVLYHQVHTEVPPLRLGDRAPAALQHLVLSMLSKQPEARPSEATISKSLQALASEAASVDPSGSAPAPSAPAPSAAEGAERSGARWARPAAMAGVVLLVVAAGFGLSALGRRWLDGAPDEARVASSGSEGAEARTAVGSVAERLEALLEPGDEAAYADLEVRGPSAARIGDTVRYRVRSDVPGRVMVLAASPDGTLTCLVPHDGRPRFVAAGEWLTTPALEVVEPPGTEQLYFFLLPEGRRLPAEVEGAPTFPCRDPTPDREVTDAPAPRGNRTTLEVASAPADG